MSGLLRFLHHRRFGKLDVRRALDAAALARLAERVRQSERRHCGEIRISVEAGLPTSYLRRGLGARDRAVMMFGKLRVWDTEANNGVLIYLLLAEHAIEIVADRGLARHVPAAQWQALAAQMREAFRSGRFEQGLADTIDVVDGLLVQHFPLPEGQVNPNELPDRVAVR